MIRSLLRIGTRGSPLALAQANALRAALAARWPDLAEPGALETVVIRTTGDRIQDRPLAAIGGKGLFIKELEEALADGRVDLAVHSMKDMPAELPPGFALACMMPREDPRDAIVARAPCAGLADLAAGCRIGTSALRRQSQILARRSDVRLEMLRGNVDTRLRKVAEGEIDVAILAAAGLRRLGLADRITAILPADDMLPAVGQGAVGCEIRADDDATRARLAALDDAVTHDAVRAERAMLAVLEGSCRTPIAGHATIDGDHLALSGLVATPDGQRVWRAETRGARADAIALGEAVGQRILAAAGSDFPRLA